MTPKGSPSLIATAMNDLPPNLSKPLPLAVRVGQDQDTSFLIRYGVAWFRGWIYWNTGTSLDGKPFEANVLEWSLP